MSWEKQVWYNQILKTLQKQDINEDSIKYFKSIFNNIDWNLITQTSTLDSPYNVFLDKFIKIYDIAFPERKIEIKEKKSSNTWIKWVVKKSSKRKKRLYEKLLKRRNNKNEKFWKTKITV